jgi:1-acyl-sn-glycerol-3-phosphate acyltransferase
MSTQPPLGMALVGRAPGPVVTVLYNLGFWSYLMVSSAVLFIPAVAIFLATFAWDKRLHVLHRYTTWWGAHYLVRAPLVEVLIEGRERLQPGQPYVYVSNHQSMADILAVFSIGLDFKWVSKIENFFAPFIGWNMILNRYISLRRGHKPSIVRMYARTDAWLAAGISVFMFPEGTRSPDGEMQEFFQGAFKIATKNRVPVVPIVIEGTRQILRKGSFRVTPHPVTIRVLPPVDPAVVDYDTDKLHALVRARMAAEQDRLRGRSATPQAA